MVYQRVANVINVLSPNLPQQGGKGFFSELPLWSEKGSDQGKRMENQPQTTFAGNSLSEPAIFCLDLMLVMRTVLE